MLLSAFHICRTLPGRIRCPQVFGSHWCQIDKRSRLSGRTVFAGPRTQPQVPEHHWQVPERVVHRQWTLHRTWGPGQKGSCSKPAPTPLCRSKLLATASSLRSSACCAQDFRMCNDSARTTSGKALQDPNLGWCCSPSRKTGEHFLDCRLAKILWSFAYCRTHVAGEVLRSWHQRRGPS